MNNSLIKVLDKRLAKHPVGGQYVKIQPHPGWRAPNDYADVVIPAEQVKAAELAEYTPKKPQSAAVSAAIAKAKAKKAEQGADAEANATPAEQAPKKPKSAAVTAAIAKAKAKKAQAEQVASGEKDHSDNAGTSATAEPAAKAKAKKK